MVTGKSRARGCGRLVYWTGAAVLAWGGIASAHIYQWEWVNPNDTSQGKQQSRFATRGGGGVDAKPGVDLSYRDLTKAYLIGADLSGADLYFATLTDADLSNANLSGARLDSTTLTGAVFTNANVEGADFSLPQLGGQLTFSQLSKTASYKAKNLRGVKFAICDLSGWDLSKQDLTGADFSSSMLGTNWAGAIIAGARFDKVQTGSGSTPRWLTDTASYQAHDLRGVRFTRNNMWTWNLAGQDLAGADFSNSQLRSTDLTGANLTGARFSDADLSSANFTDAKIASASFLITTAGKLSSSQLYSTASYKAGDLRGVRTWQNLGGWNLAGQFLAGADFMMATFSQTNLTGADLRGALVGKYSLDPAITQNTIRDDGTIRGLQLKKGEKLTIRDYHDAKERSWGITVEDGASMDAKSTMRFILGEEEWNSTIGFEAGIDVALGGKLEVVLADGIDAAGLMGRTYRLFDWSGVTPTGQFEVVSSLWLDTSKLYSRGEIRVVPEAGGMMVMALGAMVLGRRRINGRS